MWVIRLSESELGPVATIFNRFWIASGILGLLNVLKARNNRQSKFEASQQYTARDFALLLAMSCVFSGTLVLWGSLTQTSVANSNLLHNATPLFTTLIGWLFLGQCFKGRFLVAMLLAIGGSISIGLDDLQVAEDNFTGDLLACVSAIFSAVNLLIVEKLRAKFSASTILLWCSLLGTAIAFPLVVLTEDTLFPYSFTGWMAVIAQALVCQVLGQGLQAYNLKRFSSGFIAVFLLLDPVITAILAWIIFSERLSPLNLLAFFVVLVGIYLAKSSFGANIKETGFTQSLPTSVQEVV